MMEQENEELKERNERLSLEMNPEQRENQQQQKY